MEYEIFEKLENAYKASTQSNNLFERVIRSIKWEQEFQADGEYYFIKGGLTFTTPSLNPFNMDWKPSALFSDSSLISF